MKGMPAFNQPAEGIIVTLPARFFVEYTMERYKRDLENMSQDETFIWYRVMKNLPKQDFLYVYTIYEGKVQHRTNFAGLERNKTMTFSRPEGGTRTFKNANAILLAGPVIMAPYDIPMKGFQGFRYTAKLF